MTTSEATDLAINHVVDNLWERGKQELEILGISPEQAVDFMQHCRGHGYPTWAWSADDDPVFVTGLVPTEPDVMCTWFLATPAFHRYQRRITVALRRGMGEIARERGLREIEVFSACVHPDCGRWFEALGMHLDVDRHPAQGKPRVYRFVRRFEGA